MHRHRLTPLFNLGVYTLSTVVDGATYCTASAGKAYCRVDPAPLDLCWLTDNGQLTMRWTSEVCAWCVCVCPTTECLFQMVSVFCYKNQCLIWPMRRVEHTHIGPYSPTLPPHNWYIPNLLAFIPTIDHYQLFWAIMHHHKCLSSLSIMIITLWWTHLEVENTPFIMVLPTQNADVSSNLGSWTAIAGLPRGIDDRESLPGPMAGQIFGIFRIARVHHLPTMGAKGTQWVKWLVVVTRGSLVVIDGVNNGGYWWS